MKKTRIYTPKSSITSLDRKEQGYFEATCKYASNNKCGMLKDTTLQSHFSIFEAKKNRTCPVHLGLCPFNLGSGFECKRISSLQLLRNGTGINYHSLLPNLGCYGSLFLSSSHLLLHLNSLVQQLKNYGISRL